MMGLKWFLVNGILLTAAYNITTNEEALPDSVQSALETVLGFNSSDNVENINFLDKVHKVIGNMKHVFENKSNVKGSLRRLKLDKFTDFIQKVIKKINKYTNIELEIFFAVLNDEVRKYHYQGCKFHELTENYAFRTFLSGLFNEIKIQPGHVIKTKLEKISTKMKIENYNKNEKDLIDVINSLYRQDAAEKFRNVLLNIDAYRLKSRKNINLVNIIKDGLRSVIFDYYSHLNQNARRALKIAVNEYWNYLSQHIPLKDLNTEKSYKAEDSEQSSELTTHQVKLKKNRDTGLKKDQVTYGTDKKLTHKSVYLQHSVISSESNTTNGIKLKNFESQIKSQNRKPERSVSHRQNNKARNKINQTTYLPSRTTRSFKTPKYSFKYETDAYEYLTTKVKRKKLNFKAVTSEFGHTWKWTGPAEARRQLSLRVPINKYEEKLKTLKSKRVKAIRLVKNLEATFAVGMKSSRLPRIHRKRDEMKSDSKASQRQFKKSISHWVATETSAEKLGRLKKKVKASKFNKWYHQPTDNSEKKFKTKDSMVSSESSSRSDLKTPIMFYRRNNNGTIHSFLNISNNSRELEKADRKPVSNSKHFTSETNRERNGNKSKLSPDHIPNKYDLKVEKQKDIKANKIITVLDKKTRNNYNKTDSAEYSEKPKSSSNLSKPNLTIEASNVPKKSRDLIRGQNNVIMQDKVEHDDEKSSAVNKPSKDSKLASDNDIIENISKVDNSSNTLAANTPSNAEVIYNDVPPDAYLNNYELFEDKTKQTTDRRSKFLAENLLRRGIIEESQEKLDENEISNFTRPNVEPGENYDINEERFNRIREENDLVAEEFPEFGEAWTGAI